jgi:NADH:ubiquinone oxidoreductase subunit 3 (subunit A)
MGIILLGIILFLYGANYYNEPVGWTGLVLFIGGFLVIIIYYIYNWTKKQGVIQTP